MSEFIDDPDFDEVPPALGTEFDASFKVNIPTQDQIVSEVARQIIQRMDYKTKNDMERMVSARIQEGVDAMIAESCGEALKAIMTRPMQPTDSFGNPLGAPTTLEGFIAARAATWANETTESNGTPKQKDNYNTVHPRINWLLGQIVHRELKIAVETETKGIVAKLKANATRMIAEQIAEKISDLIIKD